MPIGPQRSISTFGLLRLMNRYLASFWEVLQGPLPTSPELNFYSFLNPEMRREFLSTTRILENPKSTVMPDMAEPSHTNWGIISAYYTRGVQRIVTITITVTRSEERRVGKECRARRARYH